MPNKIKRKVKLFFKNGLDSYEYRLLKNKASLKTYPEHIIFVCKGNIYRSAFAEHALHRIINNNRLKIDSCGLDVIKKQASPIKAVASARKFGIDLTNHRSKPIDNSLIKHADLILPMEYFQLKELRKKFPEKKESIKLLRSFTPFPYSILCNIDDPYGQDEKTINNCFKIIVKSIEELKRIIINLNSI